MKLDMRCHVPKGYVIYQRNYYDLTYSICKWYLYPVFKLSEMIRSFKYYIYVKLNRIGIMKTPEGCCMRLKDIWVRR